jgi:hypothetical protein
MTKNIALRTLAVFVVATTANIGVGALVDVEVWKSALMAGVWAVLSVVQKLAQAYRDGQITEAELKEIFE